jgi:hypothetical protein
MISASMNAAAADAQAGSVNCSGQNPQVIWHSTDGFMLRLDSMNVPVFFCDPGINWSVPGTTYNTTAEQCKGLISAFLARKLAGRSLSSAYFDGDSVPTSCSGWASSQKANIRYFEWTD